MRTSGAEETDEDNGSAEEADAEEARPPTMARTPDESDEEDKD